MTEEIPQANTSRQQEIAIAMSADTQAFPCTNPHGDLYTGLTKRDWFASIALLAHMTSRGYGQIDPSSRDGVRKAVLEDAYAWADQALRTRMEF